MFKMNRTIKILLFLLPVLLLASGVQSETIEVNCGDEKCECKVLQYFSSNICIFLIVPSFRCT